MDVCATIRLTSLSRAAPPTTDATANATTDAEAPVQGRAQAVVSCFTDARCEALRFACCHSDGGWRRLRCYNAGEWQDVKEG